MFGEQTLAQLRTGLKLETAETNKWAVNEGTEAASNTTRLFEEQGQP